MSQKRDSDNITPLEANKYRLRNSVYTSRKLHVEEVIKESASEDAENEVLPVNEYEKDIVSIVQNNQVVIIMGETGSGKSTQIPQLLYRNGLLKEKMICVSQPRRVAAVNLARRVAEEMNSDLGKKVGYSIRFDDSTSTSTVIKYITDGCLVRECIADPLLSKYSIIMLDEAHDRSINTDILFGLCKELLTKRPELRLIITSATLDYTHFQAFYPSSAMLEIPGRTYPVAVFHSKDNIASSQDEAITKAVDLFKKLHRKEEGHVLLFLPGQYEIEKAVGMVQDWYYEERRADRDLMRLKVYPLYGSLPSEQQALAFSPVEKGVRKLVIATNIAETSVTVPGIRFVIDPGYSREKYYDPRSGIDGLDTVIISQVSAQQRAGRAGRTGPGKCYRLYSSEVYENMSKETEPEIKRSNLMQVVLYLKILGIDDVIKFDYLDCPSTTALSIALKQLYIIGALDEKGNVTALGKRMSSLPLDPPLSRMLLEAKDYGCIEEAIIISAMLSVERVFYNIPTNVLRTEKGKRMMKKQSRFCSQYGDHFSYLNVFMKYKNHAEEKGWCNDHFIHERSMRMAMNIYNQLKEIMMKNGVVEVPHSESIIRDLQHVLIKGYVLNMARKSGNDYYRTLVDIHDNGGTRIGQIHAMSALCRLDTMPKYILFQELVMNNNRCYYHNCCEIEEEDVMQELKGIKEMKNIKLSGGSELIFYKSDGTKVEIEDNDTAIKVPQTKYTGQTLEDAKIRYLKRKGLLPQ